MAAPRGVFPDADVFRRRVFFQPPGREGQLNAAAADGLAGQMGQELVPEGLVMAVQLAVSGDDQELRLGRAALFVSGTPDNSGQIDPR